ncbi:hypothetical protein CTAYLR_006496 [Chrysophaeum taylorii]|uniref:Uncharacterized protein n=1 Tax=Chrysophaeum taylorii TaxID=2483200 RepID=A0AAD7UNF4_9STRA|nr:hypothetical protein CTAYLR_006496 [Chrysophaeum taylorii]
MSPTATRTKEPKDKKTRKGKWTIEEEEFTTRIIEFFNSGLLELPEGTTLRSYLADKLNCDPMRITKKFSGASCLGKRVFHASVGRQRDERMSRCASQQTLAAAQRELAALEARFVDAVSRSNESKDARMIDLEARFLHPSNVVSSPAIDAFIMQSCGGSLWDPDGVASSTRTQSPQSALAAATATHLAIDPSAYAEGAVPTAATLAKRYEDFKDADFPAAALEPPDASSEPTASQQRPQHQHQQQQDFGRYQVAPPTTYFVDQHQHYDFGGSGGGSFGGSGPTDSYAARYEEAVRATSYAAQRQFGGARAQYGPGQPLYSSAPLRAPPAVSAAATYAAPVHPQPGASVEARFQHLVQQQHDPNFELATRASQNQHEADKQRIDRWMASTKRSGPPAPPALARVPEQPRPPTSVPREPLQPPMPAPAPMPAPPVQHHHQQQQPQQQQQQQQQQREAPPRGLPTPVYAAPASAAMQPERQPQQQHQEKEKQPARDANQQPPPQQQRPKVEVPEPAEVANEHNQSQRAESTERGVQDVAKVAHAAASEAAKVSKDTSEASGLLLGFVKSLRRSESHNELVEFVEDVNERERALQRKNSSDDARRKRSTFTGDDGRKRQAVSPPPR